MNAKEFLYKYMETLHENRSTKDMAVQLCLIVNDSATLNDHQQVFVINAIVVASRSWNTGARGSEKEILDMASITNLATFINSCHA